MVQFTEIFDRKQADEKNQKVSSGRAWRANELRLKSNEDLHKLWYVLLKEKNTLMSDNAYKKKIYNTRGPQGRMTKIKVSMARLLTVVNERKQVREHYRKYLEDEYVKEQREIFEQKLKEQQQREVIVPEITHALLRAKYQALKKGVDNTEYIQQEVDKIQKKQEQKQYLDQSYDYKNKPIIPLSEQQGDSSSILTPNANGIPQFTSLFQEQLKTGKNKLSEQEVLRAHVKNWKMLNLKQKRIVVNFLQARRAKEAKKEFQKELDLLSQKIAYDSIQERQAN
ncbi:Ribosomal protein L29 [Pseudocohnilembus persalinus]|uniref:Large ribosomal subunit protein uL29m n=1 Tax=Pseudocohnilembus persalinus TaxID=266149 RepID=A0A0V0R2C6_PSEPJ|nr:Ribosomal protein L29 [Pseudocohnilembus persalinus]|eukprot:KRX08671.1 Ribosomal protein L29 [Pseudocohnilembus persalinus]